SSRPTSVSASHGIADTCVIPASARAARDTYLRSRHRGAIVAHFGGISPAGIPLAIASARTPARRRYGDQSSVAPSASAISSYWLASYASALVGFDRSVIETAVSGSDVARPNIFAYAIRL